MANTTLGGVQRLDNLKLKNVEAESLEAPLSLPSAFRGTFTATGTDPVNVSNENVTANSQILITLKTVGGTVGAIPAVKMITPGAGFTVAATASDTSVYNYAIIG